MNISITVMAHPKRKKKANTLSKQLSIYPFCDSSITWDEINEEWETGRRSLLAGIGKGDWHVVIQDDAILTPYFYENLHSAISSMPKETLLSLYTGQSRPWPQRVEAAVKKARDGELLSYWLLLWGVGIALPESHIKELVDAADERTEPYDTRLGILYNHQKMPIYYTMPSLIDHDDDTSSLLGHGVLPGQRIAHRPAKEKVAFTGRIVHM